MDRPFCATVGQPYLQRELPWPVYKRPPLAQSRLKHYDGKTVAFDYLDHRDGRHRDGRHRVAQFETETFIDQFVQHIPEKHFRLINFYGFMANRVRGQWLPKVYALLDQDVEPMKTIRYRNLQSRAFGVDPLNCVLCGSPLRYIGITRGKSLVAQLRPHHEALARAKIVA
ncbi:hypothetical protein AU476_05130 [Cupriavidus sp. UYMSc13B]|nr:hypothetical protein AU476_05130 [Cupriavidus sp. UYMSc13B]